MMRISLAPATVVYDPGSASDNRPTGSEAVPITGASIVAVTRQVADADAVIPRVGRSVAVGISGVIGGIAVPVSITDIRGA